jgi:hypothetical protein
MKTSAMNTVNMDNTSVSFNSNLRKSKINKRIEHKLFRRHPDNPILSVKTGRIKPTPYPVFEGLAGFVALILR